MRQRLPTFQWWTAAIWIKDPGRAAGLARGRALTLGRQATAAGFLLQDLWWGETGRYSPFSPQPQFQVGSLCMRKGAFSGFPPLSYLIVFDICMMDFDSILFSQHTFDKHKYSVSYNIRIILEVFLCSLFFLLTLTTLSFSLHLFSDFFFILL